MSEVEESGNAAADWDIVLPILSTAFKTITRDGMESALSDFLSDGDVGWKVDYLESFPKRFMEAAHRCAAMKQTGLTLRDLMNFGSISARFLLEELPIRISRLAVELDLLPFGLSLQPAVLKVRDGYLDSFRDLRSFPAIKETTEEESFPAIKETTEEELEFKQMLGKIINRHNSVVPSMALGVQQLKKSLDPTMVYDDWKEIQQTLDRFFTSRIGLCMLIEQHCASHDANPPRDYVGCINTKTSPAEVAELACRDARTICFQEYGCAPDFHIYGDTDFTFSYVPPHLHFMVFELVKNSLRAVQERFVNDEVAPPIRIIIAVDGIEHVTIKVSDEGGVIQRGDLRKIFTYLYSTAKNPLDARSDLDEASVATKMAGYGYGLPVSRLYARYFGGDLKRIWDRCISSSTSLGTFNRTPALKNKIRLLFGRTEVFFC